MRLRELTFEPPCTDAQFIRGMIAQMIYSKLGKIELFENANDPYGVLCDCTEDEQDTINALIQTHMPMIYDHIHRFALDHLFTNRFYHGSGEIPLRIGKKQ